jgi:16S rRNA (uracil1498-N3)-methyltransferase
MRLHRFFIAQPLGEEIVITDKELLKQWFSVLRYKGAEECILFNGDGLDYTYIIQSIDKQKAHLALKEKEKSILPEKEVLLVVSLIKKDKLEWIIQKGTEIGVTGFVLTEADHSEKKGVNLERLESIAKEAAEQSWRGTIPTITLTKSLKV